MSTKIYDAYSIKQMSLYELNTKINEWRDLVQDCALKKYVQLYIRKYIYYLDFKNRFGIDECNKKIQYYDNQYFSTKKYVWSILSKIYTALVNDDIALLKLYIKLYLEEEMKPKERPFDGYSHLFKSTLYLYPLKDKLLCMYFGDASYRLLLEDLPEFDNYHYQNQTDRPEEISEEDWTKRLNDWTDAIGNDFIPSNHGFCVNLINTDSFIFIKNKYLKNIQDHKELLPSDKDRLNLLLDEYKNQKLANLKLSYSGYLDIINSDKFKSYIDSIKDTIILKPIDEYLGDL